jgi:hypothetical protein
MAFIWKTSSFSLPLVDRGYHRLQWWVLDWNKNAIEFYQGLGATLMNEWTTMRVEGESLKALGTPMNKAFGIPS